MYERYAAHKVVFIAAFTGEGRAHQVEHSLRFSPRMVLAWGMTTRVARDSRIAFIGRDGNLDYVTNKVIPAQRVYDIIGNSFVPQRDYAAALNRAALTWARVSLRRCPPRSEGPIHRPSRLA